MPNVEPTPCEYQAFLDDNGSVVVVLSPPDESIERASQDAPLAAKVARQADGKTNVTIGEWVLEDFPEDKWASSRDPQALLVLAPSSRRGRYESFALREV